jgi:hypothetical protein
LLAFVELKAVAQAAQGVVPARQTFVPCTKPKQMFEAMCWHGPAVPRKQGAEPSRGATLGTTAVIGDCDGEGETVTLGVLNGDADAGDALGLMDAGVEVMVAVRERLAVNDVVLDGDAVTDAVRVNDAADGDAVAVSDFDDDTPRDCDLEGVATGVVELLLLGADVGDGDAATVDEALTVTMAVAERVDVGEADLVAVTVLYRRQMPKPP